MLGIDLTGGIAISPVLLFIVLLAVSLVSCVVGVAASWGHWRDYYVRETLDAKRRFMTDQEEIRKARTIIRVHDGLTMQQVKEL